MKVTDAELVEAANQLVCYRHSYWLLKQVELEQEIPEENKQALYDKQSLFWDLYLEAADEFQRCINSLMEPS